MSVENIDFAVFAEQGSPTSTSPTQREGLLQVPAKPSLDADTHIPTQGGVSRYEFDFGGDADASAEGVNTDALKYSDATPELINELTNEQQRIQSHEMYEHML